MQEQYVGRVTSEMQVCDVLGRKIGKIARVYRDAGVALQAVGSVMGSAGERQPAHPGIIEVKTGPLGLGHHLYIPITAIREVLDDSVFLEQDRDEVPAEWRHKPDYFDELE